MSEPGNPGQPGHPDQRTIIDLLLEMAGHTEVPQEYIFWSAMSLVAATLRSKVYYKHMSYKSIRPNLYVFLVGESGDGKGHAISLAGGVGQYAQVGHAGMDLGIYSGRLTAPHLYDMIASNHEKDEQPFTRPRWILSDELSESIRTGEMARDFLKTMTALWEKHGVDRMEGTRTRGEIIIVDPCLNWLAGSTMTWLKEVVDFADVDSGFFARTVVCHGKRSTQPIYKPDTSQYDILLPVIQEKLEIVWGYEGEMTLTPEAEAVEKEWYEVTTKEPPRKSFLFPSWKRRLDIMHKFAMLLQCAQAKEEGWSVITKGISQAAIMVYEDLQHHYAQIVEGIILGKSDRRMERVQAFLAKHQVVTKSQLQQAVSSYGVRRDELKALTDTLLDQGSIRQYNKPGTSVVMFEWLGG